MNKLLLGLLLLVGVTTFAQEKEFESGVFTVYSSISTETNSYGVTGFTENPYILEGNSSRNVSLWLNLYNGKLDLSLWGIYDKDNGSRFTKLTFTFIDKSNVNISQVVNVKTDSDGDIRIPWTPEFGGLFTTSEYLKVEVAQGSYEVAYLFELDGAHGVIDEFKRIHDAYLLGFGMTEELKTVPADATFKNNDPFIAVNSRFEAYLSSFVRYAELNGIDLSGIYNTPVIIAFGHRDYFSSESTIARAEGSRNNSLVKIIFNPKQYWSKPWLYVATTMYHELSHDILNAQHVKGLRTLMHPSSDSIKTIPELMVALQEVFNAYESGTLEQFDYNTKY